jgi:hypothetical protein
MLFVSSKRYLLINKEQTTPVEIYLFFKTFRPAMGYRGLFPYMRAWCGQGILFHLRKT